MRLWTEFFGAALLIFLNNGFVIEMENRSCTNNTICVLKQCLAGLLYIYNLRMFVGNIANYTVCLILVCLNCAHKKIEICHRTKRNRCKKCLCTQSGKGNVFKKNADCVSMLTFCVFFN